ncbi:unnamed protein product [Camellia sinensis]
MHDNLYFALKTPIISNSFFSYPHETQKNLRVPFPKMAISPTNSFTAPPTIISRSRAFKLASDCNSSESSTLLCNFLRQEGVQSIDARGNTLLYFLAMNSNLSTFQMLLGDEIVEVLLEYERDLIMVSNNSEETPLFTAASCGKKDVFHLLIKDGRIHRDHYVMKRIDGSTVLHAAIMGEYFSIPSMVYGWKHASDEENQHQNGHNISNLGHLATKLIPGFRFKRILREIDDPKQKHEFALALAKKMVKEESDWSHYSEGKCLDSTSKNSNKKTKFLDAAYSFDKNGKNILHIADGMLSDVDNDGNTILHLAASVGSSPKVVLGDLNQMTWDVCWFKHVWYESPPHFLYHENSNGMTAKELFEINHIGLGDKAEKGFKDMNNGLMLVTALIGTVNYAALFTLLGGYDQDNQSKTYGEAVLLIRADTKNDTMKFLWYISIALFSSLFALVAALSIQLSRFRSNDFYIALPFRYIVAVMALACSTTITITTCLQAYILDRISFNSDSYMWPAGILMAPVYIDALYLTSYYMFFVIGCSFAYKGQEM